MRIFYLVPVSDRHSWGMGIIYHHVSILKNNAYQALVIKEKDLFVPAWLNLSVPMEDYQYLNKKISNNDILVVPEVMVSFPGLKQLNCEKILFIQASAFLFESMPKGEDHKTLGFTHVFAIMPHMIPIIERHIRLPYTIIPPFIKGCFFNRDLLKPRKRQILLYPKFHQIDYSIVKYLIERHIRERNKHWAWDVFKNENWTVKELKNLTHKEVAQEMKKSACFISLNVFEALNTSVPEAMAAGCIVFAYEGIGPKDYLKNQENAYVFNNNEAYELVNHVSKWIDSYDEEAEAHHKMRLNARETSEQYTYKNCQKALLAYFESI